MWFWSAQVSTTFYKRVLIVLGFCLCAFILWMGLMEYSTRILKERMGMIENLLKKQIGFPITYSSIEPRWRLATIEIELNDLVIIDNETPIPFLSAKTLKLGTNPLRLILNQEQPFNELSLEAMKLVLGWDKDKDLTVLGLKGEWFPSSFDYQSLLKALSSQSQIRFKNAEISWQGPNTSITERLDGTLSFEDMNTLSWQFSGKQQIKMNDIGEFSPISFLNIRMNTPAKELNIKAEMERTRLDVKLNFPKDEQENKQENKTEDQSKAKDQDKNKIQNPKEPKQKEPIHLQATLEGRDIDLRMLHQNVHVKETDPAWMRWLIPALERGSLTHGKVEIVGPIGNLNWFGEVAFNNVNLLFNPNWPKIRKANGKVFIQKDNVKVQVYSGNILGSPIKSVEALIEPIGSNENPLLSVEGVLTGRLENGIKFLLLSPLKKTLGDHLNPLKPSGFMDLHLNLKIPLGDSKDPVEVQGQLAIEKGQLILDILELPMTNLTGLFRFTEKGVEAKGVTAKLLDKPVQIEANPSRVTASTRVDSAFLQEKFDSQFLRYLKGESEMSVSYLNDGEWVLESTLQGMSIEGLPYPFLKKAQDIQPIALTIYPKEGNVNYYAFAAKNRINAKWSTETQNDEVSLKRGQIILGGAKNADWITGNVLSIAGEMPYLNVEEWKSFLNTEKKSEQGIVLSQKLLIQISVLVEQLEAFGLSFKNTAIKHLTDTTEWSLDGPFVKGSMILPDGKNKTLQFFFQHLKLNSNQLESENRTAADLFKGEDRIPIIFNAQSLTFNDAWFGETSFRLIPKPYGYEIQELSLRNKASRLEGRGEWKMTGGVETSHLIGEVLSDNMSQTFAQWGMSSAMQEGKGRIQFNLQWPGSPFEVSFKKAEGAADLKLRSGHILGVNPGLGKVLGLLSLENLVTRRLQLDFSDVVKKGFVFDKLEANLVFKTGIVETGNLFIDGPAAKIKISGQANLSNKEIDLQMLVTPKVGNTLPIAASIATGNPAIGVGVWVVDKLTGSRISEVSQRRYHVTGTWDAPQMNELGKTHGLGRKKS